MQVKMRKKVIILIGLAIGLFGVVGCKDDVLPKPAGYLRLDYPEATYAQVQNQCPFTFEMNDAATIEGKSDCGFTITYPKMKATIYLTYKPVNNNIKNLLRDAQKLTYEHVIKADDIMEQPFMNPQKKVYGMFYQVDGNAATNSQFYATDSTKHFVTGSIYFYAKPNFDSVMPAASYVRDDMKRLLETLKWK
jgi:gliding motility-associated lipoprotein GldD